jgi:hypothetical protein
MASDLPEDKSDGGAFSFAQSIRIRIGRINDGVESNLWLMTVLKATLCDAQTPGPSARRRAEEALKMGPAAGKLTLEGCFDQVADEFAVYGFPRQADHHGFHDVPHVFEG